MVGTADPYYNRKPVPDGLIKDVGLTGLTPQEEFWNREKKYTANGADVRRFSKSDTSGMEPLNDPYYGRKKLSNAEIHEVGVSGLTPEEEYWNRERKYSVNGVDVRKFSMSRTGGMEPQSDPYYGRKKISKAQIDGVGDTGMSPAQQYEIRERKQSLFQLSTDPFDQLAGRHRQSVSGVASSASDAATRRRSSAVAPDAMAAAAAHSGYSGGGLAPIQSRSEVPPGAGAGSAALRENSKHRVDEFETLNEHSASTGSGSEADARYHDAVTAGNQRRLQEYDDPDSVAPDERR